MDGSPHVNKWMNEQMKPYWNYIARSLQVFVDMFLTSSFKKYSQFSVPSNFPEKI